jgi:hypothetical protein
VTGGAVGKLRRATAVPPRLLAAELAWRTVRMGLVSVTTARDRRRGPAPAKAARPWTSFLLTGRERPTVATVPSACVAACLREADAALSGRFSILGFGEVNFGSPPAWHDDPVSGTTWPVRHHLAVGGAWREGGDVKVPWEASRMHWLLALARAAAYTGDPRYSAGARRLLDVWSEANPVGWGVNWCNTMEVAIRAVNLIWAAEIARDPGLGGRVGALLPSHGRHIVENLEYSPSLTSNHYLADVVGLLYVGAATRHNLTGRTWLRFATRALRREVLKQFDAEGSNFEASTGYHRLSTELVLFALLAMAQLRLPLPAAVADRFARALDVLCALRKPNGLLPSVGDDDSGLVVNLTSNRDPRDPAPIVLAGRAVLSGTGGGPAGGEFQQWTSGQVPTLPARASTAIAGSGRFVLASESLWCLVECGDVGQRGNGGHAHNDTLGFVLVADGREVVTDPGTGQYTRDLQLRDRFRGTRMHATVEIDGQEINPIQAGAPFRLPGVDRPVVEQVQLRESPQRVVARHAGYRRLPDPVTHRRSFELGDDYLLVTDELLCRGSHTAIVTFPLTPETAVERRGASWLLATGNARLSLEQAEGPEVRLRTADLEVSPAYGAVLPSACLRGEVVVKGSTRWTFRFAVRHKERG